jgi:hypothetical protein
MTDNLAIWKAIERTDPKQVKPITGKSYSGHSPKPHYIIWKLTRQFGPVGYGFGWTVVHEAYIDGKPQDGTTEKIHECRILFWWRDPETGDRSEPVESYGATKALYKSRKGEWVDDEDAAKKSLTDAITKAASWLGASADIFMGRWDDSKYVAALEAEARTARERPTEAAKPKPTETPDGLDYDPETGEIRLPAANHGSAIRSAWEDGIRDGLPADATERQFYEACAAQLTTEWRNYKSLKGLEGGWAKYDDLLTRMQHEATDLWEDLMGIWQRAKDALEEAAETKAAEKAPPTISKATGEAILAGIHALKTVEACDQFEKGLRDGPNPGALAHPKIAAALQFKRSVLLGEADPIVLGEVRVAG